MKESSEERVKRIQIKEVKTISEEPTNNDVQFLIQVIMCCVVVLTPDIKQLYYILFDTCRCLDYFK